MPKDPFSRHALAWLIGIGACSLCAAFALAIFGGDIRPGGSAGADTFSHSAIGHRGIVELLEDLGVPVFVSRHASGARASGEAVLVVAEPLIGDDDEARAVALRTAIRDSGFALVVLPKWYGTPDPLRRGWLREVDLLGVDELGPLLLALGIDTELLRPAAVDAAATTYGPAPELPTPQLLAPSDDLVPLIAFPQGVLLGRRELDGAELWILSDPDLLANHGLGLAGNAVLAVGIIDALRASEKGVVFDETLHGYEKAPSIWRELFDFPIAPATLHAALVLALLIWAAAGRFGAPHTPPAVIEPGKGVLIHNTASLLRVGGHTEHALRCYLLHTIAEVRAALHVPEQLSGASLHDWLDRIGRSREAHDTIATLERTVGSAASAGSRAAVNAAGVIHRWKKEMIGGPDETRSTL